MTPLPALREAVAKPTPYYEHAGITIYHGDCRDILPHVTADVVVTDPPYGISDAPNTFVDRADGKRGPRGGAVNTWHPPSEWDHKIDPEWCRLVCACASTVAWFGQWRKRGEVEASMPHPLRAEIVWAKDMHVGPPCPLAPRDERIWIFAAQGLKPSTFETSVWDVPVIPTWEYKHHKNQKPVALLRRLVAWMPTGTVLDPFMGSGTTLVAAKQLGRKAIGIEVEERYCEIAVKRLAQEVLPLETNEPEPTQGNMLEAP